MKKLLSLTALMLLLAVAGFASGITYTATTTGVFTVTPGGAVIGPSIFGMSYSGSSFSCITDPVNNRCDIGNTPGTPNIDNLGSFTLAIPPFANYNGLGFLLTVTFTAPPGTTPNPSTFTGSLSGTVLATSTGGVGITWTGNGPQPDGTVPLPPFHSPGTAGGAGFIQYTSSAGPFVLHVNPFNVSTPDTNPGSRTVALTGHIHDLPTGNVPEPSTMGMMASGLLLSFLGMRRRFNK